MYFRGGGKQKTPSLWEGVCEGGGWIICLYFQEPLSSLLNFQIGLREDRFLRPCATRFSKNLLF